jgi:hypothetical protein
MKAAAHLLLAALGAIVALRGVQLATSRPRPQNLFGMVLAAVGVALTVSSLATAAWWLGR